MALRRTLAVLALAASAGEAPAQVVEAVALGTSEREPELPVVSARPPGQASLPPPGFAAALERLPPGVRPPAASVEQRPLETALQTALQTGLDEGVPDAAVDGGDRVRWVEHLDPPPGSPPGSGGLEVEYTLDPELEARVREVLRRSRVTLGHVILMDPATGEVLSYVSTAPEMFPATGLYPTASLIKVVTAAAVLRRAPEAAGRDCRYVGSPYDLRRTSLEAPARGGRVDSFWRAMALSNNQCFARLAVHDLGREAFLEELVGTGLLEAPAAGHPAGRLDPIDDALDLGELGSGLAGSFITPLAAARLAALLARGELVHPYWVARVRDADGRVLAVPGGRAPRRVWPPERAAALRELMVGVTARGTARSAFRNERGEPLLGAVRVAGKTGSLSGSEPPGRYQWFIGVAPAETPRIAIAALVVNGPLWWSTASDVAARTLRELFCESEGDCAGAYIDQLEARTDDRHAELTVANRVDSPAALVDPTRLDRTPTPVGVAGFHFPPRLLRREVDGEIVVLVELDPAGAVLDAAIASSDLPDFDPYVLDQVRSWRFTPPTYQGRPVEATARLPIPIRIR